MGIVSDSILNSVKYYTSKEIINQVDARKPDLLDKFHDTVNVQELISKKVDSFDVKKMENIVFKLVGKELRHIEIVGAAHGIAIGCVQIVVVRWL